MATPDPAHEPLLGLVGLGVRGGLAMPGVEVARAWLQQGKCHAIMLAQDASPRSRLKVVRLAKRSGVPIVAGPDAETLGARLGRPPVMVVAVRDRSLAAGIIAAARTGDRLMED
ncbi:MAG: L7Ae/L30e/S12e/Gadd45 family ribosomal protein [Gemmatimonadales bacterium]